MTGVFMSTYCFAKVTAPYFKFFISTLQAPSLRALSAKLTEGVLYWLPLEGKLSRRVSARAVTDEVETARFQTGVI